MSNFLRWFSSHAEIDEDTGYRFEDLNYKDGFVYQDNLSEELDSATVVIPFIEKKQFEPFDVVEIRNDWFGQKTMLISNVDENQVEVGENKYDYTLQLMSLTKGLERITLPNISITRRESGTPKTLYEVLKELLEDYSPKIFINNGLTESYEQIYVVAGGDNSHDSRLDTECPEMQMSKPTLREAIDRLLAVIYCICQVTPNRQIQLFDLNQKHNEIVLENTPEINYKDETQGSTDYASELENQYNNVTPNKGGPFLKNYTLITEYIGFRNESKAVMADNEVELFTKKPIYLIKSITLNASIKSGGNGWTYREFDITNLVYDEEAYNVLTYDDRRHSVYYSRGSTGIKGWNEKGRYDAIINTWNTVKEEVVYYMTGSPVRVGVSPVSDWIHDVFFKVEYYAQDDTIRGKSGKYLPETNENNIVIDNPSEAFVDIKRQGELFNQKVNRLGNRAKIMTGRFTNYSRIPVLGDYYEDYIVMNRELAFYDDLVNVKLTLTENFVNINYFTGINARRRSWQIVSAGEAFDKQLLDKWYCEFSFDLKNNIDNNYIQDEYAVDISEYLANVFTYTSKPILHAIIETPYTHKTYQQIMDERSLTEPAQPFSQDANFNFLELELSSYISGNSLIFNFGFLDNFSTGLSLTKKEVGGTIQSYNKYVDENGENYRFYFALLNDISFGTDLSMLTDGTVLISGGTRQPANDQFQLLQNYSALKPRVVINKITQEEDPIESLLNSSGIYNVIMYNHKDNREKININVQFEFCSDTKDIIIGRKFLERQNAVSLENSGNNTSFQKTITGSCITNNYFIDEEHQVSFYGEGEIELPNAEYLENISNVSIDSEYHDTRDRVTYSNGVFSYRVWSTTQDDVVDFEITYEYQHGTYKLYVSPKKYKVGDNKLQSDSTLLDSYSVTVTEVLQSSASIEIIGDSDEEISGESIAIVDGNNNLILAINKTFNEVERIQETIYLNLLRTRDRKVYTSRAMKYFN